MLDQRSRLLLAITRFRRHAPRVILAARECADRDEAMEFYVYIYDFFREAQSMLDTAASRLIAVTEREDRFVPYPIPGGGVIKFGGGSERTRYHDQQQVIGAFAAALARETQEQWELQAVVNQNGENVIDKWPAFIQVIADQMAEATGAKAPSFTGWRSTLAKRLGINLNNYADRQEAPITVRIEGRDRTN